MASSCSTCPVCLRELGWDTQGKLGKPENCGHLFCFTCIHEWAKNVNTCPVDRIKFNHIELLSCKNLKLIRKVYVADHSLAQVLADPEDVTYCEICHECTREDRLLLCDGCDRGYHLECLVPPLGTIPEGDWYCSLCEPIVRSQHTVIFSSDEENSVTIGSEESREDSNTLQQRQRARRTIAAHFVTDSEEDSSESEEDWSQSDFYPKQSYNHNQLSFESSGEDGETMSDMETETGQESNLESGKQPGSDSEDSSAVGSNLRPRFRKSRALSSESEQPGLDSEDSSTVGSNIRPKFRKNCALSSESEQSGFDSEDLSAVGSNLGPRLRKRRILGTESEEEEEGECDLLLQQPVPKRHRSFKDLPNPNLVSLKDEDICTFGYGSPGEKVLSDGTDTPGSTVCLLTKCVKKQTPVSDLLPCSKVGREGEANSKSLKGKEPISSSRQAKKKTPIHVIPSDNDSDTASICSGYCSPTHKFTLTSDKESFDSTFVPLQHLKDIPNSSAHITRQRVPLNRTLGQSNSKSNSDSLSAEGKLLRSAKPSMRNGSFKSLPDDFEEKILGGSISKQAGTKKLSTKGTTKKRTKKRKRGRKCVVSKRNQPSRIKKKRRRKRRRKFKQRKTPDVDPTYSPGIALNASSRGSVRTRSRARTAATHSPRDPTFRAAVIEAYRHENTITGLQQAQALLRQRRDSLLSTPLRYSTAAAIFGSSLPTPISGYNTPLGPGSKKQQQDKPFDSSTSSSTPLSRVHRPASGSIDRRNRFADEATRRTIPRRKLSGVSFASSTAHQQQSSPVPRKALGDKSIGGGDLLGEICQNLEDLQSKTNIIRRDGSIIPINAESSSPAGSPTREPKSFDRHSSHSWKDARLSPLVKDRDRTHLQQKVHHRSLDCKSSKPRFSQDHPMSWGSVIASNSSTPRQRSSACCGSDSAHTHKQRSSPFDHEHQHTCSSLHTQSVTASEKENDTLKHKHSRSSPSNGTLAHTLVKQIVKRYYKAKEITDREYKRILEKATVKVEAGHQPINEGRVERLIADYVEGYKRNRTVLTS